MHVLLIEDNCRIREIVEHGLTSRGLVVSSAGDGISGIELARRLDVDLVLLDLVLPGMGGLDVLRQIRLVKPRLPVIALTGLDDTGSKVRALDAGADDYVTKPFSIEELAARIRALLRLKRPDDGVLEAGLLRLDLAAAVGPSDQPGNGALHHGPPSSVVLGELADAPCPPGFPRRMRNVAFGP